MLTIQDPAQPTLHLTDLTLGGEFLLSTFTNDRHSQFVDVYTVKMPGNEVNLSYCVENGKQNLQQPRTAAGNTTSANMQRALGMNKSTWLAVRDLSRTIYKDVELPVKLDWRQIDEATKQLAIKRLERQAPLLKRCMKNWGAIHVLQTYKANRSLTSAEQKAAKARDESGGAEADVVVATPPEAQGLAVDDDDGDCHDPGTSSQMRSSPKRRKTTAPVSSVSEHHNSIRSTPKQQQRKSHHGRSRSSSQRSPSKTVRNQQHRSSSSLRAAEDLSEAELPRVEVLTDEQDIDLESRSDTSSVLARAARNGNGRRGSASQQSQRSKNTRYVVAYSASQLTMLDCQARVPHKSMLLAMRYANKAEIARPPDPEQRLQALAPL